MPTTTIVPKPDEENYLLLQTGDYLLLQTEDKLIIPGRLADAWTIEPKAT